MSKFVILLVAIVATCDFVHGSSKSKCLKPWGKMNFEPAKFAGDWFVIGKIMSAAVPKMASTCNKVAVTTKEVGNITEIDSSFTVKMDDAEVKMVSKGQSCSSRSNSVMLATWKKEGEDKYTDVFMQSILATDYQDFAITYACRPVYVEESDSFDKFSVLHLLGRKPEMEATLLTVLKNILGGFDFDVNEMIMVDNTKC